MIYNKQFEENIMNIITIARAGAINPSSEIEDLHYKERCLERVYWRLCKNIIPQLVNSKMISKTFTNDYLTDLSPLEYKETSRQLFD